MPVTSVTIETFLSLAAQIVVLDVRTPAEYAHAHIPGAKSLPLFSNEERKIIGTSYKQISREVAVNQGLDFFAGRMKEIKVQADALLEPHQPKTKFLVYCWRGGMRSGAVSWLLSLYGYEVFVLQGGYKSYRRFALKQFEKPRRLKLLGGYTGSGKTELLKELQQKEKAAIDLEGLANHRGSAFGALGLGAQPSQEMFENLLALELRRHCGKDVWLEDESRHIGSVHIPAPFWEQMRKCTLYFLNVSKEKRLDNLMKEYGAFDSALLEEDILKIQKRLGGLATKQALEYLHSGNTRKCFEILLTYYDKYYFNSLENRKQEGIAVKELDGAAFHQET